MQANKSLKPTNGGWQREGQIVKALYLGTEERDEYLKHLDRLKTDSSRIQYRYF